MGTKGAKTSLKKGLIRVPNAPQNANRNCLPNNTQQICRQSLHRKGDGPTYSKLGSNTTKHWVSVKILFSQLRQARPKLRADDERAVCLSVVW